MTMLTFQTQNGTWVTIARSSIAMTEISYKDCELSIHFNSGKTVAIYARTPRTPRDAGYETIKHTPHKIPVDEDTFFSMAKQINL
jgi:hypothetical protein